MSGKKQFDFQDWMVHIQAGFQTRDCKSKLANLLALTKKDSGKSSEDVFYMDKIGNIGFYVGKKKPEDITTHCMDYPMNEITAYLIQASLDVYGQNFKQAFTAMNAAVGAFHRFFADQKEQNWTLPILYQMLLDLRRLARISDKAQTALFKHNSKVNNPIGERSCLEIAADTYMQCFRTCVADTRASINCSKKWGILFITNQLFKIYFMINKLHLLKPLIRAVDACDLKTQFPLGQRVTYSFFQGRKALFENDYNLASKSLEFAFNKCHLSSSQNKQQILIYLIPVKMIKGTLPSDDFLKEHNLFTLFGGVANSMRSGDLKMFDDTIESNMEQLVKNRILLSVEKLRVVVQRTLFKKVHQVVKQDIEIAHEAQSKDNPEAKAPRTNLLPLQALHDTLATYENSIRERDDLLDDIETECVVSALIANGYMKGYIAHAHQKIVMSMKDPFPIISKM
jgi:hypothetical protein